MAPSHKTPSIIFKLWEVRRFARDDSENQATSPTALTLRARSFSFLPSRQGSSVVEQGTHKPLVGSSTLPPGMLDTDALGLHSSRLKRSPLYWFVC
jgi:hypothetical protein